MNEYEEGQIDLIEKIKKEVEDISSKSSVQDLPFDILDLLKNIKPIKK